MNPRPRLGVDVGGTKLEAAALGASGQVVWRQRVPTPVGDYPATVEAIAGLVQRAEADLGATCTVGLGTPGAVSPHSGLMKNCNSTCLNGKPLQADLERALSRRVRLANDADCLALSEAADGAAAGAGVVFAAILGTGVGGGLVVDGRLVRGPNAITGEWGHNPLPWPGDDERPGAACYCGRHGCVETWLSGPGLSRDHVQSGGPQLSAEALAEAARHGDPAARASLTRYARRLARALATVINLLDPHVVVLGGGMSNVLELLELVPREWGRWVFSDHVATRLVRAAHGDSSGVRGAAWLWPVDAEVEPVTG